jgi:3-hydroxyacyl-[acyl-carrier-protein] dehydratase
MGVKQRGNNDQPVNGAASPLACKPVLTPIKLRVSRRRSVRILTARRRRRRLSLGQGRVKFNLIDKIEHLDGDRIVAVKHVSLAEEYLADHFPTFPVLPGVMMLEAATQAAGWVYHRRTDFAKAIVVLKEARNVKYGNFVAPGNFLRVEAELSKMTEGGGGATFKVTGTVNNTTAVQARIELAAFNLAEKQPGLAHIDEKLRAHNRSRFDVLTATAPVQLTTSN